MNLKSKINVQCIKHVPAVYCYVCLLFLRTRLSLWICTFCFNHLCICSPQARVERTDIGTLLIPNIRSSDSGTYLCVGTNTVGSSEATIEVFVKRGESSSLQNIKSNTEEQKTSVHRMLRIVTNHTHSFEFCDQRTFLSTSRTGEIIPSGVTIQPSIASVAEGETLDLNCIVPGTSPASVKWSRAGGPLSSNHQVRLSLTFDSHKPVKSFLIRPVCFSCV